MRKIRAATESDLRLLCEAIEYIPTASLKGVTLEVDGYPRIVVGYDGWTEGSATMHLWVENPKYMGRDILREAFRYPFGIAGLNTVIGIVRSDNPEALRFDLGIGFTTVGVIADAYEPGVDMHILQLPKSTCRWYRQ